MRHPGPPVVVFSAIDTLLSASTPAAFASAAATLKRLRGEAVALVLCSGKTRAELEHACQELDETMPFICEHGAAAFVPHGCFGFDVPSAREMTGYQALEFGRPYVEVVDALRHAAADANIRVHGFHDMSVEAVARQCGMSLLQARLAKLREYGELFQLLDATPRARRQLARALHVSHLLCTRYGAFEHVGAAVDTSIGAGVLLGLYRRAHGEIVSVTFADGLADGDLLDLVAHPFVVGGPEGAALDPGPRKARLVEVPDVAAWAEALLDTVSVLQARAGAKRVVMESAS